MFIRYYNENQCVLYGEVIPAKYAKLRTYIHCIRNTIAVNIDVGFANVAALRR